ncbi:App1 family protein [Aurantimonas endophytica]|uniref:Phosphatidate phosphatase APP1 n=1 Tax=Aurantimonas endophytica TaxID=1522175 RepID=A0A7W6HEQ9_9HYPH|nr:phosphatase domain-containing protein [Aurantimonas endophytica]MBB4003706.1 phosphatidate phosphatase APP1 [Aurantimonas endophytica]MCO6404562.1 DUF2183 domain-containing protein [Aurantimonas endophytica]
MPGSTLHSLVLRAERRWSRLRHGVKRRAGLLGTPIILPYRGFGTAKGLWVRGRVIEDEGVVSAAHSDSLLTNLRLTFRRYESDEIAGAELAFEGAGRSGTATTDREGFFDFAIEAPDIPAGEAWTHVDLTLTDVPGYDWRPLGASVPVRLVSPEARFGIISDIDDTIVETGATNLFRHWRTVVANSAESRTAFPGVTHLYRALTRGEAGPETNPIFYVSSSPWNLFDLFEQFMRLHAIPVGPMLLRDFGIDETKWFTGSHDTHKLAMIERVMDAYPHLRFLLIGDSGQRDAAIYAEASRRHPGQVLAVHIRDVTPDGHSPAVTEALAALRAAGIPVTIGASLEAAAALSAEQGLISERAARDVAEAVGKRDAGIRETPLGQIEDH